jgi:hypothetical protein
VIPIVLHMRNGDAIAYAVVASEVPLLVGAIERSAYNGNLTINDGGGAQRFINLAAIDWIEVKGPADAAPTP